MGSGRIEKTPGKSNFFCIGKNIDSNTDLFQKIIDDGHIIGNHTFNHFNGWKSKTDDYLKNTTECQNLIDKLHPKNSRLFRPPYGKIKQSQSKKLRESGYRIIMWDVLSADFDQSITPEKCLENVLKNAVSGSIIIFHDSSKGYKNLKYVLPRTLQELKNRGFIFEIIQ